MNGFSWKALCDQLSTSRYLQPGDDLSSQRGLVATAAAIAERMSDDARHFPWVPARLVAARARRVEPFSPQGLNGSTHGGQLVTAPVPPPRAPRPGGAAVPLPALRVLALSRGNELDW